MCLSSLFNSVKPFGSKLSRAISNNYWRSITNILSGHVLRFSIKWVKTDEPPEWQSWLTVPCDGYLETPKLGPVQFDEVEWVEVSTLDKTGTDQLEKLVAWLLEVEAQFSVHNERIRITWLKVVDHQEGSN